MKLVFFIFFMLDVIASCFKLINFNCPLKTTENFIYWIILLFNFDVHINELDFLLINSYTFVCYYTIIIECSNFNCMSSMTVFSFLCCSFDMVILAIFEPESIMDYEYSFFGAIFGILNVITIASHILKTNRIFKLIDGFE